jgi:hypothetical protein
MSLRGTARIEAHPSPRAARLELCRLHLQTGHRPILRKRVTDPFYANGSQTHFTQTGRRPILRRRVADLILRRRVTAPFYEKTASAFNSVSLRWLACGDAA